MYLTVNIAPVLSAVKFQKRCLLILCWLVAEENDPQVERFGFDKLQTRGMHPVFEETLSTPHAPPQS